jgi:hypothetical protein
MDFVLSGWRKIQIVERAVLRGPRLNGEANVAQREDSRHCVGARTV